jgi:hypothetical protein
VGLLAFLLLAVCATSEPAPPSTDPDIALIPDAARAEAPAVSAGTGNVTQKRYIEEVPTALSFWPGTPSTLAPAWENRTSVSYAFKGDLSPSLGATFSDRFSIEETDGETFAPDSAIRNDVREAYLTLRPTQQDFVEVGRINIKNGVAIGFNPTDYFKVGTSLAEASSDPTVTRDGRLGVVAIRAQAFWSAGSVSMTYTPDLGAPNLVETSRPVLGLDLGQTNPSQRLLFTAAFPLGDLNPEALIFLSHGDQRVGLNISHLASASTVFYAEWSGGVYQDLYSEAQLDPGRRTQFWRDDLAAGLSWSNAAAKLSANLEYEQHDAGLTTGERHFLESDTAAAALLAVRIADYANYLQQPLYRRGVFLRISRSDAFVENLSLSIISVADLDDGSFAYQAAAVYDVSSRWTFGLYFGRNVGARDSTFGASPANPGRQAVSLDITRYF